MLSLRVSSQKVCTGRAAARTPSLRINQRSSRVVVRAEGELEVMPLLEAEMTPISGGNFPSEAGVYAVYDANQDLQYLGLSRKVDVSLKVHAEELPAEAVNARVQLVPGTSEYGVNPFPTQGCATHTQTQTDTP